MRYRYYECKTHGRLSDAGMKAVRKGIDKIVHCGQCGEIAERKFIIVCKKHGELSAEEIKLSGQGHGVCRLCHRESANARRNGNRPEFNAKMANDRAANPEKWDEIYKKQYQNKRENQGDLLSLIKVCNARKITLNDYAKLLEEQKNKCAICGNEETCIDGRSSDKKPRRLSIDHCHSTGKVRGLLCHACNIAIGKFKDDIELLKKAITYITQHHPAET